MNLSGTDDCETTFLLSAYISSRQNKKRVIKVWVDVIVSGRKVSE